MSLGVDTIAKLRCYAHLCSDPELVSQESRGLYECLDERTDFWLGKSCVSLNLKLPFNLSEPVNPSLSASNSFPSGTAYVDRHRDGRSDRRGASVEQV